MKRAFLETRVPPLLLLGLLLLLAWGAGGPRFELPGRAVLGLAAMAAGLGLKIVAALAFRARGTTVNPISPERSAALVVDGLYRVTRNPMYLGSALILAGWALHLGAWVAVLTVPFFVLYMNRFQIGPEERALSALFGADYDAYRARVRRWI
ncbi:MAG: isoprenylcysteine carboxylmethyltransferase family protein [Alphaproteobacteria bacterium]|nr:isoprenylcysteine carboxylmethyltransferase family protein [Alphaproteobacteria bacterium]